MQVRIRSAGEWQSNHGLSNQNALLAMLLVFSLGLIALGLILNVLNKPSPQQATAHPATTQTQNANSPSTDPRSNELGLIKSIRACQDDTTYMSENLLPFDLF
jgi:hypothetical protein